MANPVIRVRQQPDGSFSTEVITPTPLDRDNPISVVDEIVRTDNLTFDQLVEQLRVVFAHP